MKPETTTPVHHLRSKSMVDDDPFSSPTGLRLSSPHPPTDATIPDAEQDSPLAPLTTSQNGLDATIKSRQVRRGAAQDKNRRSRDSERPTSTSLKSATVIATSTALRKSKEVAEAPVHADREEGGDAMDESQTYDIERDLYDIAGTPMMDLSVRPPRRIAPTHRAFPSHARHGTLSSITADSQDRDHEHGRDRDGRKSSSSRYREREVHLEKDVRDDSEQHWGSGRLSGVSFGQPIAASSPPDTRRTGRGQGYDRLARTASNTTTSSLSSRTSLGSSVRATSPAMGIMARPSGLGFAPSEMDAYLGIQVACEKIAKTHGFQSDAVFRVYQEVKDLRKAEEIVVGMKHAAEKDAIERIMKVREKSERRRTSERVGEGSSHRDRDGDPSRTSRRSYDIREQEEEGDDDDDQEISQGIIYEEEGEDPDGQLRIEHLSHRNKRSSAPSTSAARHRGGYDRHRMPTAAVRKVREREDSVEYHPPTPTRASLWERLSKSGRHPETALLGESLRASLSMPRYETVDHE